MGNLSLFWFPLFPSRFPSYTLRRVMPMIKTIRWRWGLLAALAMMLLSLLPQFYLWRDRGRAWNGAHAFIYADETVYAAYVNALIDERPRRNDPYTGSNHSPSTPLPETQFSIQFVPAYLMALPARALGLSTATVFLLLAPAVAFTTTLALFWLLALLTNDDRAAAAFVPFVLCLGVLLSGSGVVRAFLGQPTTYSYLPFLRRYMPAGTFPWFMLFFPCVWLALVSALRRQRIFYAIVAGVFFASCVYGYFFLWTAALAWLVLVALLWFIFKPDGWREALKSCALVSVIAVVALIPYALMLSQRGPHLDTVQVLVNTHAPDLWRSIEGLALLILIALIVGCKQGKLNWRDPGTLISAAFALLPFLLFNQQVVTGRSLQSMHYEQYVASYTTLTAAALTIIRLWHVESRRMSWRLVLIIACASYGWGLGETLISTRRFAQVNVRRDAARPVEMRLRELGRSVAADLGRSPGVVFSPDFARADHLPMLAPQGVLWAPHMIFFSTLPPSQYKERFFQYLYYSGVSVQEFEHDYLNQNFAREALFGWEREHPNLTSDFKPITAAELDDAAKNYGAFVASFDRSKASQPALSYLLHKTDSPVDLTKIDRWYSRDSGEPIGGYMLYRLTLREHE